jgi:hypothetical protein
MSTKNSIGIGIETLTRALHSRRRAALIELVHHHGAEILPPVDHVPVTNAECTHLLHGDGTVIRPGTQLERGPLQFEASAVARKRFLTDTSPRAAPDLIAETRTRSRRLETEHAWAQLVIASEVHERRLRLSRTSVKAERIDSRRDRSIELVQSRCTTAIVDEPRKNFTAA